MTSTSTVDNAFIVTKTPKRQIVQFRIRLRGNYAYVVVHVEHRTMLMEDTPVQNS